MNEMKAARRAEIAALTADVAAIKDRLRQDDRFRQEAVSVDVGQIKRQRQEDLAEVANIKSRAATIEEQHREEARQRQEERLRQETLIADVNNLKVRMTALEDRVRQEDGRRGEQVAAGDRYRMGAMSGERVPASATN
jgi:hypothetical protein